MSEHPVVTVTVSGLTGSGKSAIAGEIEIALKAIGVPAVWKNGDAEKRMTHADWQRDLEMYEPRVEIVEANIPHAAAEELLRMVLFLHALRDGEHGDVPRSWKDAINRFLDDPTPSEIGWRQRQGGSAT